MRLSRLAFLAVTVAVALSACEDPSNVGLGLIGESGGEPEVVSLKVESYAPLEISDISGGAVLPDQSNPTPRFIAGVVQDPLIGTTRAVGHIDFTIVSGITEAFRNGPVSVAEIRLTRDYVYGDTTSSLELQIREIPGEWDARAPVDTTITVGDLVTAVTVPVSGRDVVIPLPDDWVEANSALLRSESFGTEFQGFSVASTDGNAVLGFSTLSARLRVVSAGDTVNYVPSRALTTTSAERPTDIRTLVQDGTGVGLTISLPDSAGEIGPSGVNGASIRLPADTLLSTSQAPTGFARPTLSALRLVVRVLGDAGEVRDSFVADAVLNDGAFVWPIGSIPETLFQELVSGREVELTLSPPPALFTLNPVLLVAPDAAAQGPVVVITLTSAGI